MQVAYEIEKDSLYQKGIQRGRKEGIKSIVIRCLEQWMSFEEVASITGLEVEEIEAIHQSHKL